jgi:hypothetical protein
MLEAFLRQLLCSIRFTAFRRFSTVRRSPLKHQAFIRNFVAVHTGLNLWKVEMC